MSEDINKKIRQITDILGQENLPDNLKNIISLFSASDENEGASKKDSDQVPNEEASKKNVSPTSVKEEKNQGSDMEENLEMVRKIKRAIDGLTTNNDPRINLLNAIRPFLNMNRQKKVSNCIKLLHMASLSKFIDENEKISF